MFKSNKVNHMTVIVKGVRDDDYEGRELMMEVVRRNCKMDPRLVGQTVYSIRTYEDADQCKARYGYVPGDNAEEGGEWTATGTQFQVPYVFKTLFSKEPIEFSDLCETKSVSKGAI